MTDNEIIKALEEELKTAMIINHRFEESNDTENPDDHKFIALLINTIKLINRQKEEIERLTKNIEFFVAMLKEHREIVGYDRDFDADIYGSHIRIGIDEFNNLVKETVGDH